MKKFLLCGLVLILGTLMAGTPALVRAQTTVPGYVEQLTGNTKNGIGVTVLGANGVSTTPSVLVGYQQITSLSTATALTVPTGATMALIQVSTQNVRYRGDGTNPTATVGQPLLVGAGLFYYATGLASLKFIEQTASASLDITYYK